MSEIQSNVLPIARKVLRLNKLGFRILSLKIFKILETDFHGELHQEVNQINELTPSSQIFMEVDIEHETIGRSRIVIKGCVDENGEIQFIHTEIPIVPTQPDSTNPDKSLKKEMKEFLKEYQSLLTVILSAVLNLAISILKKAAGLG